MRHHVLLVLTKSAENTRSTSLIWPVSFDAFSTELEDGEDAVFYFSVYKTGVDEIVSTSHYFNVTFEAADETPTSTASRGGEPTSTLFEETTSASTSTSGPTTTAETISDDDDGDSGLSTGAVAGIAVGATLGGIAAIAAIGFFLWKRRRANKAAQAPAEVAANTPLDPNQYGGHPHQEYYKPPESQGTPSMVQYAPSQPSNQRSELGDNPWNPPPQGGPRAQDVGGLHEAP